MLLFQKLPGVPLVVLEGVGVVGDPRGFPLDGLGRVS